MSVQASAIAARSKAEFYTEFNRQLAHVLTGERDWIANLAQTAALLKQLVGDLNWAGFYLLHGGDLVLGPFQGKIACTRIRMSQGVCGAAAIRRTTVIVPDVSRFAGHIACDPDSRSEIVVPILKHGRLLGVLDLDSPLPSRFDEADKAGLEQTVTVLLGASNVA